MRSLTKDPSLRESLRIPRQKKNWLKGRRRAALSWLCQRQAMRSCTAAACLNLATIRGSSQGMGNQKFGRKPFSIVAQGKMGSPSEKNDETREKATLFRRAGQPMSTSPDSKEEQHSFKDCNSKCLTLAHTHTHTHTHTPAARITVSSAKK